MSRSYKRPLPDVSSILNLGVTFDPNTGLLYRNGLLCTPNGNGQITLNNVLYSAARIAYLMGSGASPVGNVVRRNGVQTDLRIENLLDDGIPGNPTVHKIRDLPDSETAYNLGYSYDAATGLILLNGVVTGSQQSKSVWVDGKRYNYARICWLLKTGVAPEGLVDHWDGNDCNNKWSNLRDVNYSQNAMNRKIHRNCKYSPGVGRRGKYWFAEIRVNRRRVRLGKFGSMEEAVAARKEAEVLYFGEFSAQTRP